MVKPNMNKNMKKRSASESEAVEKKAELAGSFNRDHKKKKTGNGDVQNGQANKQVKKDIDKKPRNEKKKDSGVVQSPNKKETEVNPQKNKKKLLSKEELLKKRQEFREKRKLNRHGKFHGIGYNLSVEEIKKKIQLIESREKLSKSAKRRLGALKKKLSAEEGTDKSKQVTKKQTGKAKNEKSLEVVKKKQIQSIEQKKTVQEKLGSKSNKENKKKNAKQNKASVLEQKNEEENENNKIEEELDIDDESSEDEDESDVEAVDEEEEEEDDDDDDNDDEDDDDDDDDSDVEEKDKEGENNKQSNIQKLKEKGKHINTEDGSKKKRYVLFVGNLPYNITEEELKKLFLTKVSHVVNVRMPKGTRGFAHIEFANSTDYEKALSLHNSFLNGRRINVQYSGSDKKASVAKNMKLHALQKAGKLAGGRNRFNQKFAGNKGKQNMRTTKT